MIPQWYEKVFLMTTGPKVLRMILKVKKHNSKGIFANLSSGFFTYLVQL